MYPSMVASILHLVQRHRENTSRNAFLEAIAILGPEYMGHSGGGFQEMQDSFEW